MSITETSVFATVMEYSALSWVELSVLCIGMFAGYLVTCQAVARKGKTCTSLESTETSPSKPKTVGSRIGFQREPLADQEASILLQQGKVKAAVALLQKLPETQAGSVPTSAARSILITAMRTTKLSSMRSELEPLKGKIPSEPLDALMAEAADKKDAACCRQLHALSCLLLIPKSPETFEILANAYAFDAVQLRGLVEEAPKPLATPFAKIVLQACSVMKSTELATDVLGQVSASDKTYMSNILEQELAANGIVPVKQINQSPRTTSAGSDASNSALSSPRSSTEEPCKRGSNASNGAVADGACFDTRMEGFLANGQEAAAKELIDELASKDLATADSYHGLLSARIHAGDQRGAWRLIADMQVNGISPNAATCSILLKAKLESIEEVSRVLLLVDMMEEPMDDVLFMALADACVGVRRLDVLSRQLDKFHHNNTAASLSAQSYGSMIKAYGQAYDLKRVRDLWSKMMACQVALTSIVVGCMVEALVANGVTAEAWRLVHEDKNAQSLLDASIYSTILNGFTKAQSGAKAVEVYQEMKASQMQTDAATFNAILYALAQGGAMQHVPTLIADMKAASPALRPTITTYRALVKGYCDAGKFDGALAILKDMTSEEKQMPDEVLGACAKVVVALGGAGSEQGMAVLLQLRQ